MSRYVAWLDRVEGAGTATVGGKGASLARLAAAGFPVPPGFALTVEAYRDFHDANGLDRGLLALAELPARPSPTLVREACRLMQSLAESAALPAELESEVALAFALLEERSGPGATFAVRSSSAAEDGAHASFAGLYESYINLCSQAEVIRALALCYRCLWEPRAVHYRAMKGFDHRREAMGVVVMQTVASAVSGVAFTRNPITGAQDEILVNSAWGLGESIVSGLVTPDNFVVGKDGFIRQRDIFEKTSRIVPIQGGTATEDTPLELAAAPSLDEGQLRQVLDAALEVEQHYGVPMDVEFAFDKQGRFYLLQARPITT